MTRMTDERLALFEGFSDDAKGIIGDELIAALKAERAKVRELEQERDRYKRNDELQMHRAEAAESQLTTLREGIKTLGFDCAVRHGLQSGDVNNLLWCASRIQSLLTQTTQSVNTATAINAGDYKAQLTTLRAGIQALLDDGALYTTVTVERVRLEALIVGGGS